MILTLLIWQLGPGTNSRTATGDQHVEESYKFAIALVDCSPKDPRDLSFRRGVLIEDIEVYTHGKERIFNGRIRSSRGNLVGASSFLKGVLTTSCSQQIPLC